MYYLMHRQRIPDKVTRPPDGLTDLMSDITREVLRSQPPDYCLYKFIADYLDALLRVREKTMVAQSVIDDLLNTTQNVSNFLQQAGLCYNKAHKATDLIKKAFHDYIKKKRTSKEEELKEFKELELITELITKCKFTENEIKRAKPAIREAFRQFINDYLNLMKATVYGASTLVPIVQFTCKASFLTGNLMILNNSAKIIQRTFRGYRVRCRLRTRSLELDIFITKILRGSIVERKRIKRCAPFDPLKYECIKDEMLYCKLYTAAQIIQRNFRQYLCKMIYKYAYTKRILDRAATIIEKNFKGYIARKIFKKMFKLANYKKKFGIFKDDCQRNFYNGKATIIQAVARGYITRNRLRTAAVEDEEALEDTPAMQVENEVGLGDLDAEIDAIHTEVEGAIAEAAEELEAGEIPPSGEPPVDEAAAEAPKEEPSPEAPAEKTTPPDEPQKDQQEVPSQATEEAPAAEAAPPAEEQGIPAEGTEEGEATEPAPEGATEAPAE